MDLDLKTHLHHLPFVISFSNLLYCLPIECYRTRGKGCVDPRRDSPAPVQPLHSGSPHDVICFPHHVTSVYSAVATGWGVHAGAQVQAQVLTQEEALVQGEPSGGQGDMHSVSLAYARHCFKCRIISFDPLSTSVRMLLLCPSFHRRGSWQRC